MSERLRVISLEYLIAVQAVDFCKWQPTHISNFWSTIQDNRTIDTKDNIHVEGDVGRSNLETLSS